MVRKMTTSNPTGKRVTSTNDKNGYMMFERRQISHCKDRKHMINPSVLTSVLNNKPGLFQEWFDLGKPESYLHDLEFECIKIQQLITRKTISYEYMNRDQMMAF